LAIAKREGCVKMEAMVSFEVGGRIYETRMADSYQKLKKTRKQIFPLEPQKEPALHPDFSLVSSSTLCGYHPMPKTR
jgi:hypothetical protein